MHRLIRWYSQNKIKARTIIALIAFTLMIIYALSNIQSKNEKKARNEISFKNSSTNQSATISKANQSVITGKKMDTQTSNKNQEIIKLFVNFCNSSKTNEAYAMLSDECKEVVYPTVEAFERKYYQKIFDKYRIYSLQNWYSENNSSTYYITYTEDIMANGKIFTSNNKYDYITVIYTDNGYRLNINSYVGRKTFSKTLNRENIIIQINYIDQYIDHTTLNITVKNDNTKTIAIDSTDHSDMLYIYDDYNVKYSSYINEFSEDELTIKANDSKTLNIKFSMIYNPEKRIEGIVFSNVVLNYEAYSQGNEKKDRITIKT